LDLVGVDPSSDHLLHDLSLSSLAVYPSHMNLSYIPLHRSLSRLRCWKHMRSSWIQTVYGYSTRKPLEPVHSLAFFLIHFLVQGSNNGRSIDFSFHSESFHRRWLTMHPSLNVNKQANVGTGAHQRARKQNVYSLPLSVSISIFYFSLLLFSVDYYLLSFLYECPPFSDTFICITLCSLTCYIRPHAPGPCTGNLPFITD
jgi:hypothetical protein